MLTQIAIETGSDEVFTMLADEVKSDLYNVIDELLNLMKDSDTEFTAQKMKFPKEDFFSKCDRIRCFL